MKLIRFERPDGAYVWVNAAAISSVTGVVDDGREYMTKISLAGGIQVVRGDPNAVAAILMGDEDGRH